MNQREWRYLRSNHKGLLNFTYYNQTRQIQKSLQYNNDPEAKIIHHLRDTEEQRRYNDEHYELWGHNLDGTFEYGKYVVFVTKKQHNEIHRCSEETKKKISESNRVSHNTPEYIKKAQQTSLQLWEDSSYRLKVSASIKASRTDEFLSTIGEKIKSGYTDESRKKMSESKLGCHLSDETKQKISESLKVSDKHPWRGKCLPEDVKAKISASEKGRVMSDDTKKKISDHSTKHMLGKHLSDETKEKLRNANLGRSLSDEAKQRISEANKGKVTSDETKQKISEANKGRMRSEESRKKISESLKKKIESGWNPNKGRKHSDETKEKYRLARLGTHHTDEQIQDARNRMLTISQLYKEYKSNGGTMTWNEFQRSNRLNKRESCNE